MKKNSFYLFAMMMAVVLCVGFTSCGDDDDDNGGGGAGGTGTISGSIVGTWKIVQVEGYYEDGKLVSKDVEDELPFMFYQFKDDGTAIYYERYDGGWGADYGTYTYSGNILIAYGDNGPTRIEILNLTSTELKVKFESDSPDWSYDIVTMRKVSDSEVPNVDGGNNEGNDEEIATPTLPDDISSYASNILGVWQHVSDEHHYADGTVKSNNDENSSFVSYIRFNADKIVDFFYYYYSENRWNITHAKYKLSGNTLTETTDSGDEQDYTIVSLTHSELKLRLDMYYDYVIGTFKKVDDSVIAGAK